VSQSLASALSPSSSTRAPTNDEGGGPDGAPFTPPKSFQPAGGTAGGVGTYTPSAQGKCSTNLGGNVKVNQNCLNISDPDLQGRGQANNEPSIAQDPMDPSHLVASDNNYIRGDGTCGAHFSLDGGRSWADSTVPNGFTRGPTASLVRIGRRAATPRSRGTRAATRT
jgi:hypothetical protein